MNGQQRFILLYYSCANCLKFNTYRPHSYMQFSNSSLIGLQEKVSFKSLTNNLSRYTLEDFEGSVLQK